MAAQPKKESKPKDKKATTSKIAEPKPKEDTTRIDAIGFKGGLNVSLGLEHPETGELLRDRLAAYINNTLNQEQRNQETRIDDLAKWDRQYRGIKDEKAYPHASCSNVAIPRTRIDVDSIVVRVFDVLWGQKKLFVVEPKDPLFLPIVPDLEDALEWWQSDIAKLREKTYSPILQAVKSGTGVGYLQWGEKKRTIPVYATQRDIDDDNVKTFKLQGGGHGKYKIVTEYEGPLFYGIPREDLIVSAYVDNIDDAPFVGFRTYVRTGVIKARVQQGIYYDDILENLKLSDVVDDTKKERTESQGKEIKDNENDIQEVWQLHVLYDVDGKGVDDDIIISWHPRTQTILRAIYNPIFYGFRPIEKLVALPSEYSFEGTGLCEKLEQLQETLDMIFNLRLDRLTMINAPPVLVRDDVELKDFELVPGLVQHVDSPEGAIQVVDLGREYPETERMEMSIHGICDQTVGIGPANLGQPTSERPVARETFMLIQETNKGIKFIIDNIRDWFSRIGQKALEMIAQYKPSYTYYSGGEAKRKTIDFPLEYLRDGIAVKLRASSEVLNQEVKREIALAIWQLLAEYMTRVAGMAQMLVSPAVPPDFKMVLFEANRIGVMLMKQIIREFGLINEEELVLDLEKAIDMQKALAQPYMPPPPQGAGQGAGQGGGQPQGGQGGAPPMMGM